MDAWAQQLDRVAQEHGFVITKVILTHWHHDHVGGVDDVLRLARDRWHRGSGSSDAAAAAGQVEIYKAPDAEHDAGLPPGVRPLADGAVVAVPGATLRAVTTPGHTDDHVCLLLEEEGALFAGDMVLGQGTTVFTNLRTYMASLRKAHALQPAVLYPGHGPVVADATAKLHEYWSHRHTREQQIVARLAEAGRPQTIPELVAVIYAAYPVELHLPAQHSVAQHLGKLLEEGRVRRLPAATADEDDRWQLVVDAGRPPAAAL